MQNSDEDLTCPICFGYFEHATQTNCGHSFCAKCILDACEHNPNCPICRSNVFALYRSYLLQKLADKAREQRPPNEQNQERTNEDLDQKIKTFNDTHSRPQGIQAMRYDYNIMTRVMTNRCNKISILAWTIVILVILYMIGPYSIIPLTKGIIGIFDDLFFLIIGVLFLHRLIKKFELSQRNQRNINVEARNRPRIN
ncbi:e3 ubiquitin-protein ligase [Anaeramoeba ignava]|uniref:E3 ubiquitin-protein ligase n=1 Tax=Anaeramoeba ignava TaxID=1746090 RepID=A0A9Q0LH26_ANAIG|nr:e3 ubiquitin-protein ligase [Anaeramoeba ignava]|eukprot:Anaeramoba_ignava/a4528_33.p1 GENE.a4528_33~~a4528_33.p1  ORF type:complete len:197 (-),score=38.90 a4528_33:64-654(-)